MRVLYFIFANRCSSFIAECESSRYSSDFMSGLQVAGFVFEIQLFGGFNSLDIRMRKWLQYLRRIIQVDCKSHSFLLVQKYV